MLHSQRKFPFYFSYAAAYTRYNDVIAIIGYVKKSKRTQIKSADKYIWYKS